MAEQEKKRAMRLARLGQADDDAAVAEPHCHPHSGLRLSAQEQMTSRIFMSITTNSKGEPLVKHPVDVTELPNPLIELPFKFKRKPRGGKVTGNRDLRNNLSRGKAGMNLTMTSFASGTSKKDKRITSSNHPAEAHSASAGFAASEAFHE